jgi:uncharacterized small protein (DUF1192 family)
MITLRTGATATNAVLALRSAARTAGNVIGRGPSAQDVLDDYRRWANSEAVLAGQWVADSDLHRVITTERYWALHSAIASSFAPDVLQSFVQLELKERIAALNAEADLLDAEFARWSGSGTGQAYELAAVVLDTNVLLSHSHELDSLDWHSRLGGIFDDHALGLAIPNQVIRELDRSKMSNNNTVNRGTKNELRADAKAALKTIEDRVVDPGRRSVLRPRSFNGDDVVAEISLLLIADRYPGQPLQDPDSEIVDRAVSLLPFSSAVYLVSYDAAIVFRARQAGLKGVKWTYPHVG